MLAQDRAALNRNMRLALANAAPALPFYLADDVYEPDEGQTWTSFAFNPDTATRHSISSNTKWKQVGIATLQIMQPKNLLIEEGQHNAWDIADIGMSAFKGWRSDDKLTEIANFSVQRIPNDKYVQVNLLIFWRSKRP